MREGKARSARLLGPPKLSVLLPTYNRRSMLERCLQSVLTTTVECEIVVCDDASTDGTWQLIEEHSRLDSRIRPLRNERNLGIFGNVLRLLGEASGEYISFVADDDSILPGYYETKIAILDAHPQVGVVFSPWFVMDGEGRRLGGGIPGPPFTEFSYVGGRDEFSELLAVLYMYQACMVVRSSLVKELNWTIWDWDDLLRWSRSSWEFAYLDEPLSCTGVHEGRYSQSVGVKQEGFATFRLALWRKWLAHNRDALVVDDMTWQVMRDQYAVDLRGYVVPERIPHFMKQFDLLREDYIARVTRQFAASARNLSAGKSLTVPGIASPSLIWSGPALDVGEEGEDLRGLAPALAASGLTHRVEDVHWRDGSKAPLTPAQRGSLAALGWAPVSETYVQMWHLPPQHFHRDPAAAAVVGRLAFWGDAVPTWWLEHCNQLDALWVPNEFNLETLARGGIARQKLRVLPPCIDAAQLSADVPPIALGTGRSFNFLSIVEWSFLKGWDILVRAWAEEFAASEDVALLLVVHSLERKNLQQIAQDVQQVIHSTVGNKAVAPIRMVAGLPGETNVLGLYRAAQAYVQPSRAEAYGRQSLEAMAAGLPVIAVRWGTNLSFMTEKNSFLVDCRVVEAPLSALPPQPFEYRWERTAVPIITEQTETCHWAEPSVEQLRFLLRHVATSASQAADRARQAQREVLARFNPAAVGTALRQLSMEALKLTASA